MSAADRWGGRHLEVPLVAAALPQRRLAIVAAVAMLAVLSAGCTGAAPSDPTSPTTPAPSPSPELGPDFPTGPQEYAEAAVVAVAAPDLRRLAELATPEVHRELIDLPGPPDPLWTFIRCDEDNGSSDCSFYNTDGDYLAVQVRHDALGQPRAATAITFQETNFPTDHLAYVAEFVAAWQAANLARMNALARPDVVGVYQELAPAPVTGYHEADETPGSVVVLVSLPDGQLETHLVPGLLGGPQAIVHVVAQME